MITGKKANPDDIRTVGITKLESTCGGRVKLLARASLADGKVYAEVSPVLLPEGDVLTCVPSDRNGIVLRGAGSMETAFFGVGAGAIPTASAVLSDIVEAVKCCEYSSECAWSSEKLEISPWQEDTLPEYRS